MNRQQALEQAHKIGLKIWDPKDRNWGDKKPEAPAAAHSTRVELDGEMVEEWITTHHGQSWFHRQSYKSVEAHDILEQKCERQESELMLQKALSFKLKAAVREVQTVGGCVLSLLKPLAAEKNISMGH